MGRPKKKHAGGRPTVMTPATIGKLEQAFALGCPKTVACEFAGINTDTLYEYINKNPEFSDRIKQLQGLVGMQARKAVADAIKKGDAKIAIDYLKRKYRDEFSEQHNQKVEVLDDPALNAIAEITRNALSELDALKKPD